MDEATSPVVCSGRGNESRVPRRRSNRIIQSRTFYPSYYLALALLAVAVGFFCLWVSLVVLGLSAASADAAEGIEAGDTNPLGPAIVIGIFWLPMILLFLDIAIGILRSRVKLTDEALDLTTTRFAIWRLRRVHRVRLAWNEVLGVQVRKQTNAMINPATGLQVDYVIHTMKGPYCVTERVWPQARTIADAILERIGRELNDIDDRVAPIAASRKRDRWGLRILRGLGLLTTVVGVSFCLMAVLSLFGRTDPVDAAIVVIVGVGIIGAGESLRRYFVEGVE